MRSDFLPLKYLAWGCAILPLLTIHISYLVAASNGHVDWCVPYWESCTSISAAGRQIPEKIWFKLGMIPSALLAAWFWNNLRHCLIDSPVDKYRRTINSMFVLGLLAAFFLGLYTVVLGEEGDTYQRIRRIGVTLSFAFTYLAQLTGTRLLGQFGRLTSNTTVDEWHRRLLGLLIILLLTGITSVLLDAWLGVGYDDMEDAFEWNLALLLNLWFAGIAIMLGKSSIRAGSS